jgi:hypothetical protein
LTVNPIVETAYQVCADDVEIRRVEQGQRLAEIQRQPFVVVIQKGQQFPGAKFCAGVPRAADALGVRIRNYMHIGYVPSPYRPAGDGLVTTACIVDDNDLRGSNLLRRDGLERAF